MDSKRTKFRLTKFSAAEMATRKFGRLHIKNPTDTCPGSGKRVWWICDCGREVLTITHSVMQDGIISCGHCHDKFITTEHKFGNLRIKVAGTFSPESHKRVWWICDCGREIQNQARYVISGTKKSCGHCKEISAEKMAMQQFGKLRMRDPKTVTPGSNKKAWWTCTCGKETEAQIVAVISGRTQSCGNCADTIRSSYLIDREVIRSLKTPINATSLPTWCPKPLGTIYRVSEPFEAICPLCGSQYAPRWSGIRDGVSLTCGCSSSRISLGQREIFEFIQNIDQNTKLEYKVGGLIFDLFVPSKNLLIEFNGLKWHSRKKSKSRDLQKYKTAILNGYDFIGIFEDEWINSKEKIKILIQNRLGSIKAHSLRPKDCSIKQISMSEADIFLDKYHYIGRVKARINYGAYLNNELIACISFKNPSRQSRHPWELVRMVSHPEYKIHGIWSKFIRLFITEYEPSSIVSFSDNRLFSGSVYQKIGFKHDGNIRSDYYWVKGGHRYHKSKLRKTEIEKKTGKTEVELREAEGYARIWDVGKKRWIYGECPHNVDRPDHVVSNCGGV
jgi:predicted SprT family Zn-dependent metalloprotease